MTCRFITADSHHTRTLCNEGFDDQITSPGKMPFVQPDSLSWPLAPGTDLVMQLHLLPGPAPVIVQPEVGIYYAETPATLRPVSVVLNSMTIDIPAGEAAHVVRDSYRLPVAVDVLAIYPHAHYLGKEIHATATLPDSGTVS